MPKQRRTGKRKQPASKASVSNQKIPQVGAASSGEGGISWRFSKMDMEGTWSCAALDTTTLMSVREKLVHFENGTWGSQAGTGSAGTLKRIPVAHICDKATKRPALVGSQTKTADDACVHPSRTHRRKGLIRPKPDPTRIGRARKRNQ